MRHPGLEIRRVADGNRARENQGLLPGNTLIGTPLPQTSAGRVRTISDDHPEPGEAEFKRRVNISLSAMWRIGLLTGTLSSLAITFSLTPLRALKTATDPHQFGKTRPSRTSTRT